MLSHTPQPAPQPHRQTELELCAYRALYRSDKRDYGVMVRRDMLSDWILQLAWGGRYSNKWGGDTRPFPSLAQALEMADVVGKTRKAHKYELEYAETAASRETGVPALTNSLIAGLKKNAQPSALQQFRDLAPQMLLGDLELAGDTPAPRKIPRPR